jgi:hypothetical protein
MAVNTAIAETYYRKMKLKQSLTGMRISTFDVALSSQAEVAVLTVTTGGCQILEE